MADEVAEQAVAEAPEKKTRKPRAAATAAPGGAYVCVKDCFYQKRYFYAGDVVDLPPGVEHPCFVKK